MQGFPVEIVGAGPDLPAWFQAAGSVAAIVFAGMFSHKDRLNRRAEAMEAFDGIVREVERATSEAEKLADDLISGMVVWTYSQDRFNDLELLLKGVPVFELGASNGASTVTQLTHHVRSTRQFMNEPPLTEQHISGGAALWIENVRYHAKSAREIAKTVNKWRRRRERRARLWFLPLGPI